MYPLQQLLPKRNNVLNRKLNNTASQQLESVFSNQNFWGWTMAIFFSAILNIFLFGIMPGMIQQVNEKQDKLENIRSIQVVRVKRPDSPVKKNKLPEPEKNKKIMQQKTIINKQVQAKLHKQKISAIKQKIPFELNPKLPITKTDLKMSPMEQFNFDIPTLKNQYLTSELDAPLIPLIKIPPIYPLKALKRGIEGWVKVKFIVNTLGAVENIEIIDASPARLFNESVKNCVIKWKFKSCTVDGVPVSAIAQTIIKFKLE